jgi:predicted hydrocarbon binding protein
MNGTIFLGLRKYVRARLGQDAWEGLLDETGIGPRLYVPVGNYPDQEAVALIAAAANRAGRPVDAVLEDFGEFIVPDLMTMYASLIDPGWKTIDLITNTERTIHEVLRRSASQADPPRLKCTRHGDSEVVVIYDSPRKMCPLAKGIARGIARRFDEKVDLAETSCMLKGSPRCEIRVRLVK